MDAELRKSVLALWAHSCVAGLLRVPYCVGKLELDHVRPQPPIGQLAKSVGAGGFAKRPEDRLDTLMPLCWFHHQGGNPPWGPAHRQLQRDMLAKRAAGNSLEAVLAWGRVQLYQER